MKKFVGIILVTCIVLSVFGVNVFADESEVKVFVAGEELIFDVSPIVENGRTLVPIRAISEYLKYEVNWDNEKWEAEIKNEGNTLVIGVDKTEYTKNGEVKEMDVPAKLVNGRTLVPLRLIAENFGCAVEWDNDANSAYIKTNDTKEDNLSKVSNLFDIYPIPDYNDYSPGSINNPLAADTRYGKYGDDYYCLTYQPYGKDVRFVTVSPVVTLVSKAAKRYVENSIGVDSLKEDENKRWKVYIVTVVNLGIHEAGATDNTLNINELFGKEHVCTQYAEKYPIYDYYITKALTVNENAEKGKVYTSDDPCIQESDYVGTYGICILSDKDSDAPLFKLIDKEGSKATWLHLDATKTKKKIGTVAGTTIFSDQLYDFSDNNEVARYIADMKLRQLEAKQADIMKEYMTYLDAMTKKGKGTTLSYINPELENKYKDSLMEIDTEIARVKNIFN